MDAPEPQNAVLAGIGISGTRNKNSAGTGIFGKLGVFHESHKPGEGE